ncbi:hypothetical protein [Pseudoxanthomonas koreensis]|uniref:hypothetical protein n=1 Tax=Pseudoxanthomonas koreensis TaxID=266061 RepID=UPI0035A70F50
MKVVSNAFLVVLATLSLCFSFIACLIAPPTDFSSRDLLIIAIGLAGIVFAVMAGRGLARINRQLRQASA